MEWFLHRKPYPGQEEELVIRIQDEEMLLGRGRDCNVHCLSMYVSRHHLKIFRTVDGLEMMDLGSSNGTFLNDEKIDPEARVPIDDGDEIGMGNVVVESQDCFVFIVRKSSTAQANGVARASKRCISDSDEDIFVVDIADDDKPSAPKKSRPTSPPADPLLQWDLPPDDGHVAGKTVNKSPDRQVPPPELGGTGSPEKGQQFPKSSTPSCVSVNSGKKRSLSTDVSSSSAAKHEEEEDEIVILDDEAPQPALKMALFAKPQNPRLSALQQQVNASSSTIGSNSTSRMLTSSGPSSPAKWAEPLLTSTPANHKSDSLRSASRDDSVSAAYPSMLSPIQGIKRLSLAEQEKVDNKSDIPSSQESSRNYTVDEDCVVLSDDDDDDAFPCSQMFEDARIVKQEPGVGEEDVKQEPEENRVVKEEFDELDEPILVSDSDEDDEGAEEASRWLQRLSQSFVVKDEADEARKKEDRAKKERERWRVEEEEEFEEFRRWKELESAKKKEKEEKERLEAEEKERAAAEEMERKRLEAEKIRERAEEEERERERKKKEERRKEKEAKRKEEEKKEAERRERKKKREAEKEKERGREKRKEKNKHAEKKHRERKEEDIGEPVVITSDSGCDHDRDPGSRRPSAAESVDSEPIFFPRRRLNALLSDSSSDEEGSEASASNRHDCATPDEQDGLLQARVSLSRVELDPSLCARYGLSQDEVGEESGAPKKRPPGPPPIIEALPMPERRAHLRGISANEANRLYALKDSKPSPKRSLSTDRRRTSADEMWKSKTSKPSSSNDSKPSSSSSRKPSSATHRPGPSSRSSTRRDKKALEEERKAKLKALGEKDRAAAAARPKPEVRQATAKVKVTANNRGTFLTEADVPSPVKPRVRQDIVKSMKAIPKVKGRPAAPYLPTKSPLQDMNMSYDRIPSAHSTSAPSRPTTPTPSRPSTPEPPKEIPTGPQPKKRVAQKPPPGFLDGRPPTSCASPPKTSAPQAHRSPPSAVTRSPPSVSTINIPSIPAPSGGVSVPLKSCLSGSSRYNTASNDPLLQNNKKSKKVVFKENIEEVLYIEKLPGTKPVSSSRDADRPRLNNLSPRIHQGPPPSDESCLQDVIYDISKWNPVWLKEEKNLPPDVVPPVVPNVNWPTVPQTEFLSFSEYYNTMYPLLMLELWAGVSREYHNTAARNQHTREMFIAVDRATSSPVVTNQERLLTTLHCHMVLNEEEGRRDLYPKMGNLVILDLLFRDGNTNKQSLVPVFAYVSFDAKDRIDMHMQLHKDLQPHCQRPAYRARLSLTFRDRRNCLYMMERAMRIKVAKYIRPDLRVFQAMKNLAHLRLLNSIISPTAANEDFTLPSNYRRPALKEVLNETQQKAVLQTAEVCLQEKPKICLIQGPPGTGKSQTITALIMQLLYHDQVYNKHNQKMGRVPRILLCAPSNNAIDLLVRRLLHRRRDISDERLRFKMVRVGRPDIMHPDVRGISLQELSKAELRAKQAEENNPESLGSDISNLKAKLHAEQSAVDSYVFNQKPVPDFLKERIKDIERRIRVLEDRLRQQTAQHMPTKHDYAQERDQMKRILRGADIVATTLTSCLIKVMETVFQPNEDKYHFTVCIVDEATQCLEPETLIPLMLGVKTMVLVGDPNQLPATILSKLAREKGLGTSLFARLHRCLPNAVQVLDTQYRMHPEILRWPNKYFYEQRLKTPPQLNRSSMILPYAIMSLPYTQDYNREVNRLEAKLVIRLACLIIDKMAVCSSGFRMGIVTPYQRQRRVLQDLVSESMHPGLRKFAEVNTVDSFQGQEKDVIIMSCVRTTGVGFLADSQRLNVALTRARYSMFICGNFESLGSDKMWSSLLTDAKNRKCFLQIPHDPTTDQLWNYIHNKGQDALQM